MSRRKGWTFLPSLLPCFSRKFWRRLRPFTATAPVGRLLLLGSSTYQAISSPVPFKPRAVITFNCGWSLSASAFLVGSRSPIFTSVNGPFNKLSSKSQLGVPSVSC